MSNKEAIVNAIMSEQFRITDHAYEEALSDNLTFEEVLTSVILSLIRAV
jgi:hypothetical protein